MYLSFLSQKESGLFVFLIYHINNQVNLEETL